MKPYYPVRICGITIMLLFSSLFYSCSKTDVYENYNYAGTQSQNTGATVISSVAGFVTDATDQPVAGASVQAGNTATITDQYGYFEINNAEVTQNAAVVTVTQAGYFKGIKTYIATAGEDAFFRIKLIPKTIAGTINGAAGGTVSVDNDLHISFMPGGIINASTGAAYTGTVNVAAFWINPVAGDLNRIMPGDLRGIAADGTIKGLTTYGMAAVELTGTYGELLQIAPGKEAKLTMTIPASSVAYAPASIPLWYFDEKLGLWTEQGIAIKTGNSYSGDVSHFSFWNLDDPAPTVRFNCTVTDIAGNPVKNALIKISSVSNPNSAGWGFTNGEGYASGPVPANMPLLLEVMGDAECNTPVSVQHFTTTNSNISLGKITVSATAGMATVAGNMSDCNDKAISNGCIILQKNDDYFRYPIDKNGAYHFKTLLCNNTAVVNLMAYDADAALYSVPANYTLVSGKTTSVDLKACGNAGDGQFIKYNIKGVSHCFTSPAASFAPVTPGTYFTFAVSNSDHEEAGFQFPATAIANSNSGALTYFFASQANELLTIASPVQVNITERGTTNQIFAGNFSGTFKGAAPNNKLYTISCSFRVRCQL